MMNTSVERVDALTVLSDRIYDSIDQEIQGEVQYRRILRLGINAVALSLKNNGSVDIAGDQLLSIYNKEIHQGTTYDDDAFKPWTEYTKVMNNLPDISDARITVFDEISTRYADVTRATVDRSLQPESDARHAIHLMGVAVPYALQHYPQLNHRKVAAYGLVHDIVEAYTGDIATLGISNDALAAKHHAEELAVIQLRKDYGNEWPEFVELVENYESLIDPESKFARTKDKLDPGFTHAASNGLQLLTKYGYTNAQDFLQDIDNGTARMLPYANEFPEVLEDRKELTRRVALATPWPEAA